MDLVALNAILIEASISFSYIVAVFFLQVGAFFIKQWLTDRKLHLSNILILSYGLFFVFLALGEGVYGFIIVPSHAVADFEFYYLFSIIITGIGTLTFTFVIERQILKKTKYLLTLSLLILLVLIPFFTESLFFNPILLILKIFTIVVPFFFFLYFIRKTSANIQKKLIIALIGFGFISTELILVSYNIRQLIETTLTYPGFLFFSAQMGAILGSVLLFYAFFGYSFLIESEWRSNLITLLIIDKTRNVELYYQDFLGTGIRKEEVLAGGIAGLINLIKEFTESQHDIDLINLENNCLMLSHGEKIITALLVKKELQQARYFLKIITLKFEFLFWDYIKYYESYKVSLGRPEMYKPIEMLIRDTIKI